MKQFTQIILITHVLAVCCKALSSGNAAGRAELRKKIFKNYDNMNIPDNVTVMFSISIIAMDVDEGAGIFQADVWLKYIWTDSRLKWDNKTNNIDILRVGSQEIWKPDIAQYNSANFNSMMKCSDYNPVVYSNGRIQWLPPCEISSPCQFNLGKFTYEVQKCYWEFGSWTYDTSIMNFKMYKDYKDIFTGFLKSEEWKILSTNATRIEKKYACCDGIYAVISVEINFQRHCGKFKFCRRKSSNRSLSPEIGKNKSLEYSV